MNLRNLITELSSPKKPPNQNNQLSNANQHTSSKSAKYPTSQMNKSSSHYMQNSTQNYGVSGSSQHQRSYVPNHSKAYHQQKHHRFNSRDTAPNKQDINRNNQMHYNYSSAQGSSGSQLHTHQNVHRVLRHDPNSSYSKKSQGCVPYEKQHYQFQRSNSSQHRSNDDRNRFERGAHLNESSSWDRVNEQFATPVKSEQSKNNDVEPQSEMQKILPRYSQMPKLTIVEPDYQSPSRPNRQVRINGLPSLKEQLMGQKSESSQQQASRSQSANNTAILDNFDGAQNSTPVPNINESVKSFPISDSQNQDKAHEDVEMTDQVQGNIENQQHSQPVKRTRMYKTCQKTPESGIQAHLMTLERFLDVSQVITNQFVRFMKHIKDDFLAQIQLRKQELKEIVDKSILQFNGEVQSLFKNVIKALISGFSSVKEYKDYQEQKNDIEKAQMLTTKEDVHFNFLSFKHSIKRIYKACVIQLEDFQTNQGKFDEGELSTPELVKNTTSLISEIIETEQSCKQYLDLIRKKFVPLFELLKQDVLEHVLSDSSKEHRIKVLGYFNRLNNYQGFENALTLEKDDPKYKNCSLFDLFTTQEYDQISMPSLLLMVILELGNNIDSATVASKILSIPRDAKQEEFEITNMNHFVNWKRRKCHCCMEYILDTGKASICANIINTTPCTNIYCQSCLLAFMEQKCPLKQQADQFEDQKQAELAAKKRKHMLWLRATQNPLFECPCCQGSCLTSTKSQFSYNSYCNFKKTLENDPSQLINRDIYLYHQHQSTKKRFHLCKIQGMNSKQTLHKVEKLQYSQILFAKLSKEEFFFADTVKLGSRLFQLIDKQGLELDLKIQIDKQIRDFNTMDPYVLLEKYELYLDKCDYLNDGFQLPKFDLEKETSLRVELVSKHRELYRRYDGQMFQTLQGSLEDIFTDEEGEKDEQKGQSIKQNGKNLQEIIEDTGLSKIIKIEAQGAQQSSQSIIDDLQNIKTHAKVEEILKPVVLEEDAEKNLSMVDLLYTDFESNKQTFEIQNTNVLDKNKVELLNQFRQRRPSWNKLNNFGTHLVLEKNLDFVLLTTKNKAEQLQLLLAKDCFKIEQVHKRDMSFANKPFFHTGISQDVLLSHANQNKIQLFMTEVSTGKEVQEAEKEKMKKELQQLLSLSLEMSEDKKPLKNEPQCQVKGPDPAVETDLMQIQLNRKKEDGDYIDYLKSLQMMQDRKEYNLRQTSNARGENSTFNEKELLKKSVNNKQHFNSNKKPQFAVEEGFFDDFPPEIIKKYKLKVSEKTKFEPNKRQKLSEDASLEKKPEDPVVKVPDNKAIKTTSKDETKSNEGLTEPKTYFTRSRRNVLATERTEKKLEKYEEDQSKSVTVPDSSQPTNTYQYIRNFIINDKLKRHYQIVKNIVQDDPKQLEKLFVYVYRKDRNNWKRAFLQEFIVPPNANENGKRIYLAEYQDRNKTQKRFNLLRTMFIIDCTYQAKESEQDKAIGKLLRYPLFNSRARVRKLLEHREPQPNSTSHTIKNVSKEKSIAATEESKEKIVKSEDSKLERQPKSLEQKTSVKVSQEQIISKEETVDQIKVGKSEPKEIETSDDKKSFAKNQQSELQIKVQQIEQNQTKMKEETKAAQKMIVHIPDDEIMEKQRDDDQQPADSVAKVRTEQNEQVGKIDFQAPAADNKYKQQTAMIEDPKPEWIKGTKLQMLSKTRNNSKKILKFYFEDINEMVNSSGSEDEENRHTMVKSENDDRDLQNKKINQLITQIQEQQFRKNLQIIPAQYHLYPQAGPLATQYFEAQAAQMQAASLGAASVQHGPQGELMLLDTHLLEQQFALQQQQAALQEHHQQQQFKVYQELQRQMFGYSMEEEIAHLQQTPIDQFIQIQQAIEQINKQNMNIQNNLQLQVAEPKEVEEVKTLKEISVEQQQENDEPILGTCNLYQVILALIDQIKTINTIEEFMSTLKTIHSEIIRLEKTYKVHRIIENQICEHMGIHVPPELNDKLNWKLQLPEDYVQQVLVDFYHRMIVYKNFKKCQCPTCIKMIFPMLIKCDEDSVKYLEVHHESASQNFQSAMTDKFDQQLQMNLVQLFSYRKSQEEIRETLHYKDLKLQYKRPRNFDSNQPSYGDQNPCFKIVINNETMKYYEQVEIDRSNAQFFQLPAIKTVLKQCYPTNYDRESQDCANELIQQIKNILTKERLLKIESSCDPLKACEILMQELKIVKTLFSVLNDIQNNKHLMIDSYNELFNQVATIRKLEVRANRESHVLDKEVNLKLRTNDQNWINSQLLNELQQPYLMNHNIQLQIPQQVIHPQQAFIIDNSQIYGQLPSNMYSNFNNCQIFQPQIINAGFIPQEAQGVQYYEQQMQYQQQHYVHNNISNDHTQSRNEEISQENHRISMLRHPE